MARDLRRKKNRSARSPARLLAVQALYQMEMAGSGCEEVIAEFIAHRIKAEGQQEGSGDAQPLRSVNAGFFGEIVRGVVALQRRIDPEIDALLAKGWRLNRIDSILRAILRSAAFELEQKPDIPARAIISEYVDIARAFFEGAEPGVVNGVLDSLARRLRPAELEPPGPPGPSAPPEPSGH